MSMPGVAFCQLPAKKIFSTPGSTSPFSTSVMVGKTLYISGMGDHLPGGGHPEGIAESTRQTLENIRTALKEAGMDMVNVVKCWVYMEDLDKFGEMNTVYATFFSKDPPARTTLGVGKIPGDSPLEITCIAYSDLSEKKVIGTPPPGYPFSSGILVGNTLYLSGKADQLPSG